MPWAYSHILLCPQSFSFFTRKTPKLVSPKPSKAWSNSTGRYTNLSWLTSKPCPRTASARPPPPLSHTLSPNCKRCSFKFLVHYLLFNFIFLLLFSFFHFHFIIKIFAQVIAHLGLSAPWLLCPQEKSHLSQNRFYRLFGGGEPKDPNVSWSIGPFSPSPTLDNKL